MQHTEKVQKIRSKINEACPELLKLEFGCQLYHPQYKVSTIVDVWGTGNGDTVKYFTEKGHKYYSDTVKDGKIRRDYSEAEYWEILGKPPTLEHLLRTISDHIFVDNDGVFYGNDYSKLFNYNLTKGVLDQDEVTTESIYQLICE